MTDVGRCRWAGSDRARVLVGRHEDGCAGECEGCQECTLTHCDHCGITHVVGVCPGCVGDVREDLREILRMVGALPEEVEHRGVNSEAMVLLGPAVNPEAWEYHTASWIGGRAVPVDCDARELDDLKAWLETADHDHHPLLTLGRLEMVARAELGHDTTDRVTVEAAANYLDRQLTNLAYAEWFDWGDLATSVGNCRRHLEDVLRDGERPHRSRVPCIKCGVRLVRRFGNDVADDDHVCPHCGHTYTSKEYSLAMADWLSKEDAKRFVHVTMAAAAVDRPERTLRTWLRRLEVTGLCDVRTHRLLVWWPDVRETHRARYLAELQRKAG